MPAALPFIGKTYRGPDGQSVVVSRDVQHHLLGDFIFHLFSQNARFLRALVPVFRIVEVRGLGHDNLTP
jgi:hypothetical protein